jgi:hypothetical protein
VEEVYVSNSRKLSNLEKDSWAFRTHWCCIQGNKEVFKSYYLHGGVLGEWSMAMGKLQSSYSKRPYISSAEITIMCTA